MKVLVTGASGFVGRYVVRQLLADEHVEVVVAGRRPAAVLSPRLRWAPADLLAPDKVEAVLAQERPTHLIHLAWVATPGLFWSDPSNLDWAGATIRLLRAFASAGGQRAVFAGSCAEYDWTRRAQLSESSPLNPATLYGVMKRSAGQAVTAAAAHLGVSLVWARLFWLYGPHEGPGRLVSDVCRALAAGQRVEVSEGRQQRDFMHVADVANALVHLLAKNRQGAINVATGVPVAVRDIVTELGRAAGRPHLLQFGARPSSPNDPPSLYGDIAVLRDELRFVPATPLERGLHETYTWWLGRSDAAPS